MVLLLIAPASANSVLTAELTGAAEVPGPGHPDATGTAFITALDNGQICWEITFDGLDEDLPNAGHIHEGAIDAAGPVVLDFGLEPDTPSPITGCAENATLSQELEDAPADYYVNIHTELFPDGAIRGQLSAETVLEPADAVAYINPDVGLETANENVPDDSTCENPTQADTQTVSSGGGVENNVHIDACLFDTLGNDVDTTVSWESSGVGTISACPDPDMDGPKTATLSDDGLTCAQTGFQIMGAPGPFEYHARFNSEEPGTQTVIFCYDDNEDGSCDGEALTSEVTINWVAAEMVMIMKHYCNADDSNPETTVDVRSEEEFMEVEAGGMGDPVVATALTVLACPVERLPGDLPVADTIAHFEEEFDFEVTDSTGATFTLADATFGNLHACEQERDDGPLVIGEVDGDESTNVCVDFSFYGISGVAQGEVTVVETFHEGEHEFGTVRFTPAELDPDDDSQTLLGFDRPSSTVNIDTSLDDDGMVMLHIYNFDTADDAAPAPTPTPAPLPDTAGDAAPVSIPVGLLAVLALAALTFVGWQTVEARRSR